MFLRKTFIQTSQTAATRRVFCAKQSLAMNKTNMSMIAPQLYSVQTMGMLTTHKRFTQSMTPARSFSTHPDKNEQDT